jgi:hypothetical protein
LTAIASALTGFASTPTIAGFAPVFPALTETACGLEADLGAGVTADLAVLAATAPTLTDGLAPETAGFPATTGVGAAFAFGVRPAGLADSFDAALADFPAAVWFETTFAFGADERAFTTTGCTEMAGFDFVAAAPLTLTPLGEGLPACPVWVVAGFTLTVAGAAGVCTAVVVCANAAADRSMSIPRFRII